VPPAGYFEKIMKVCTKYDLLMIADEVICGFGRLGRMFGSEVVGFRPDTVVGRQSPVVGLSADRRRLWCPERMYQANGRRERQDRRVRPRFSPIRPPGRGRRSRSRRSTSMRAKGCVRKRGSDAPRFQQWLRRLGEHPLVGEARGIGLVGGSSWLRTSAPSGRSNRSSA